MISQNNYEVGGDLVEQFTAAAADNTRFFAASARAGHALFDLPGYIVARLQRAGVMQIENVALCTYADATRFYSYRRTTHRGEPDYGRHISAIALAD
jgi:copper oxidase (laccase) domain-containing protein